MSILIWHFIAIYFPWLLFNILKFNTPLERPTKIHLANRNLLSQNPRYSVALIAHNFQSLASAPTSNWQTFFSHDFELSRKARLFEEIYSLGDCFFSVNSSCRKYKVIKNIYDFAKIFYFERVRGGHDFENFAFVSFLKSATL